MLTAWGKGDDDLEPSAKMLALIEELKVADREGDKTIVYSQCELIGRLGLQAQRLTLSSYRDVHAGLDRDAVWTVRDTESEVRRQNESRGKGEESWYL